MRKISDNDNDSNHSSMMTMATILPLNNNNQDYFVRNHQNHPRIITNENIQQQQQQQNIHHQSLVPVPTTTTTTPITTTITTTNHQSLDEETMSFQNKIEIHNTIKNKSASKNEINIPIGNMDTSSSSSSLSSTCDPIIYRDIQWPPTPSGTIAIRSCPHDTSGM
ncbi:hypothetical protein DERF_008442 [Dermatophagoides farinae]|uniref:Uncharacterized protein n=1 Tax=Dermatophagoides farinae TaxID=6954 RepID=A0A922L4B6_DERFA|nr:hypothetical protein DERF_008442 [Dermatophagoides farinae]